MRRIVEDFLTVDEAAAFLRVSRCTLYRLLHTDQIQGAFRLGETGTWRIGKGDLEQWITDTTRKGGVKRR